MLKIQVYIKYCREKQLHWKEVAFMNINVHVKNTSVYKILQRKAATLERGCFHEYKCTC